MPTGPKTEILWRLKFLFRKTRSRDIFGEATFSVFKV
jgi:hypothetical protein